MLGRRAWNAFFMSSLPPLSSATLLDVKVDDEGAFQRADSVFREIPKFEAGRYHLYVSPACPWSHRAIIVRQLCHLEDVVSMSWVKPYRDERGWAFGDGEFEDPVEGMSFLREAYEATTPGYGHHVSVPVLWDRQEHKIVNNESEDIVRFFPSWSDDAPDLYPQDLRDEIDRVNDRVYNTVNNGVYKAGFSRSQRAYELAYTRLFESLEWLDELLSRPTLRRGRPDHRGRLAPVPDARAL